MAVCFLISLRRIAAEVNTMEIVEMTGDSPVVARVSYDLYSPEYKRGMVLEWASS